MVNDCDKEWYNLDKPGVTHICLFSGGFDSTLILLRLIRNIRHGKIWIISISPNTNSEEKNEKEAKARKEILEYFKKKYPTETRDIMVSNIKMEMDNEGVNFSGGLAQPQFWASIVTPFIDTNAVVYLGYNKDDQGDIKLIQRLWQDMVDFTNYESCRKCDIEVIAPYKNFLKEDILKAMYDMDENLFDLCVCCESDKKEKYCTRCLSCREFKRSIMNVITTAKPMSFYDKRMAGFFNDKLKEWFHCSVNITYDDVSI
jgi:7-cyano-7-deazaguanine synthase in queuosine biosynthesis